MCTRFNVVPFIVALVCCSVDSTRALAQKRVPGEIKTITLPLNGGDLPIRFRYCPSGKLQPDNPADKKKEIEIGPLFMSETEITQEQFFAILKNSRDLAIPVKVENARLDQEVYVKGMSPDIETADKERYVGARFPVCYIGVHEATFFCLALEALFKTKTPVIEPSDLLLADSLVSYRFRLPTHHEWQHACRASSSDKQGFPHFNTWPEQKELEADIRRVEAIVAESLELNKEKDKLKIKMPDANLPPLKEQRLAELNKLLEQELERELAGCLAQWKELKYKDTFLGTQEQIARMLFAVQREYQEDQYKKVLRCLSYFLKRSCGIDMRMDLGKKGELVIVGGTRPNAWGLSEMHGNAAEWTLSNLDDWELLRKDDERLKDREFVTAGGNFSITNAKAEWERLTIWGGNRVKHDKAANESVIYFRPERAGIRLVLEVVPSANLFASLRGSIEVTAADVAGIDRNLARLQQLRGMSDTLGPIVAKSMEPQINYYKAMLLHLKSDFDGSESALDQVRGESVGAASVDGDFLKSLKYLVQKDKELSK